MARWITTYLDENADRWKTETDERQKNERKEQKSGQGWTDLKKWSES